MRTLRYAWASPATLVGLLLGAIALALRGRVRRVDGCLEFDGGRLRDAIARLPGPCRFCAITLGHVIVGVDARSLDAVRAHEHVHVRQYERYGLLFFPLYLGSSLVQLAQRRDPYRDNRFEREAFAADRRSAAAKPQAWGEHTSAPGRPKRESAPKRMARRGVQ